MPGNQNGSIPACAGEPEFVVGTGIKYGVYPRVCGGTCAVKKSGVFQLGLSPRVRGNLPNVLVLMLLERSIPACAGEPLADKILILLEL